MTEDQLEQQCLEWFAEDGWEIAHGPDLAPDGPLPEPVDYRQVLLLADLEAAIRRIVNAGLKLTRPWRLSVGYKAPSSPNTIRNAFIRWHNRQTEQKLTEKGKRFALMVGAEPADMAFVLLDPAGAVLPPKASWGLKGLDIIFPPENCGWLDGNL